MFLLALIRCAWRSAWETAGYVSTQNRSWTWRKQHSKMHLDPLMLTKFGWLFSDCAAHHGGSRQRAGLGPAGSQDGLHQGLAVAARVWHHLLPHPHGQQQEGGEELAVGWALWTGGVGMFEYVSFVEGRGWNVVGIEGLPEMFEYVSFVDGWGWNVGIGCLPEEFEYVIRLWGWMGCNVGFQWLPELLSRDP